MYVHTVTSWLQLTYILWVFYVIILSICHKFIESSIYGGLISGNFFAVCKAIISRESALGHSGLLGWSLSIYFSFLEGNNINRVGPRVTKSHLINLHPFFHCLQVNNIKRAISRGTEFHWVHAYYFLTGSKAIISRESSKGALRLIDLIYIIFLLAARQ